MLKGEQAAEQVAASRYARLKAALGFGKAKPQPALGPILAGKGGKEFPISVEDRATLGEVRQLIGDEPPSFLHGPTPMSRFYDAVRARGNPKWSNSDIRTGIDRLLEGRENIYGRAALEAAREAFPREGGRWRFGLRGLPAEGGQATGGFARYAAKDAETQAAVGAEDAALKRFLAPDEPAIDVTPGGLNPALVGKQQVGPSYQTRKAAVEAAAALQAQGRKVEAVSYDRNAHVVLEARPEAPPAPVGREPGEEGFAQAQVIQSLAGAGVGGAVGATQGETPGERVKYGALGALIGAGGMAVGSKLGARLAKRGQTEMDYLKAGETPKAPRETTERATMGLSDAAREMASKELPSAVNMPPEQVVQMDRLRRVFGEQADDLARVLRNPSDKDPGFAAQRRHRIPIERQKALANLIRVDVTKPGPVGKLLNAEETIAHQDALTTLTTRVAEKAKGLQDVGIDVNNPPAIESMSDPQIMQLLDWQETRQWQETVFKTLWGSSSEQGRALAANKIMARVRPSEIQIIRDVMRKGRFGEDVLKAARIWGNLDVNDPVAVFKAMKDVQQRGLWDKVMGYWVSNILSGIKTQERNFLGNLTRFATNTVMKGTVGAPVDALKSALTGAPRTVYAREVIEDLTGGYYAMGKAWDDFWYTLKNGFSKEYLETALELEGGFTPRPEFGKLLVGSEGSNFLNWPGRILDAMDRAFYQLNSGAETYAQSYTRARNEATRAGLTGQAKTDFIAKAAFELRKKPDLELTKGVHQAALEGTYRENEGEFGRLIQQMRRVVPGLTMAMPFVKTVSNIARQGYEVTPVSGVVKLGKQLMGNERAWNRVGGEREATMMQAKAVLGTAATGFFAYLASSGRLSGSGPTDRATRAQMMASGWRPNSIKLDLPDAFAKGIGASKSDDGQYWVNYSLFQPLALSMNLVANSLEAWNEQQAKAVKSSKVQDAGAVGIQTAAKIAKSALNQSYLQGLFSLVDAINNGQMSAGKFAEQIAQGFVPMAGMGRNVAQAMDPVIRDPRGIPEALMANTPGLSTRVSPRLGRYGEPIERTGTALRRFLGVPEVEPTTNDWIDKELNRLGVSLGSPTDRITLPEWVKGDRKITEEQSLLLREARGRATRASLFQLMRSPGYAKMPEWAKTKMARKAIQRGTYMAANAARISFASGRPELLSRMMAPIYRRAEASYEPGRRKGM
jgi:hypothetical protein